MIALVAMEMDAAVDASSVVMAMRGADVGHGWEGGRVGTGGQLSA